MTKRRPVILVTLISFWVIYVGFNIFMYWHKMYEVTLEQNEKQKLLIKYQNFVASPLMLDGQTDALIDNLDKAKESNLFDYYILKAGNKVIGSSGVHVETNDQGEDLYPAPLGDFESPDEKWMSTTITVPGGDAQYTLTTGFEKHRGKYISRSMAYIKWDLIQDFVMVTAFLGIILYLVLKDILDLTKILQSRNRSQAQLVKVRTKEADVLMQVTQQYEQISKSLKLSNETLSDSLSPAVRYELAENTPVPHLFPAVVVRIDINGYTQMFLERKVEFVTSTLNEYFQRASELIHRYGGHIYQFVGDEIVFHFKEYDHDDARIKALSCVRSLFEIADDMDKDLKARGIPFVVKAAIARGRLRFVKLDTGYAFAGLPLIESVRMLGKIEEREVNTLTLYAEDFQGLEGMALPHKRIKVEFKGFNKQTEIIEVRDFASITGMLQAGAWQEISNFRSDRDLEVILDQMAAGLGSLRKDQFLMAYRTLREFSIQRVGGRVAQKFAELFVKADELAEGKDPRSDQTIMLASITHLGATLLRSGAFDERIRKIMEKNMEHADQRVRANTMVALDELSPEAYSFREMFALPFNRAAADALWLEGKREYTSEIHHFLKSFIQSDDTFFMASGLYVLGAIYDYHRKTDPVYFKANELIQSIPKLIDSCIGHHDPMVARRAQMTKNLVEDLQVNAA